MMAKHTIEVDVCEIQTIRVQCMKCDTIVQIATDRLAETFRDSECKHCKEKFPTTLGRSVFEDIAKIVDRLHLAKDYVSVSFVLDADKV